MFRRRKMDLATLILEVFSFIISIILACLALKMLIMFRAINLRGGKVSRSWYYMLVGYISLALGLTAFMVQHFLTLHFLRLIGSAIMTAGGVLFIICIYHEYRIWKSTLLE